MDLFEYEPFLPSDSPLIGREDPENYSDRDSSSSYASSDDEHTSGSINDIKRPNESEYPISRSTVAAQSLQKQRISFQLELNILLQERNDIKQIIDHTTTQLDAIRKTHSGARAKRQSSAISIIPENSTSDSKKELDDSHGEPPNKKSKLEENSNVSSEETHHSGAVKGRTRQAIQNPLMQRLLVGTLQKSQKEVERDKTDKSVRLC
jgi:hypothetical protein